MSKKLLIFDRDGCLNKPSSNIHSKYIFDASDFILYDDVIPFFEKFKFSDLRFAVATNQRGISLGSYTLNHVESLHRRFLSQIAFEPNRFPLFVCPHGDSDINCSCRKPKPGLLISALDFYGLQVSDSVFIGDSLTDFFAAKSIGMDFILLNRSNNLLLQGHEHDLTMVIDGLKVSDFIRWCS